MANENQVPYAVQEEVCYHLICAMPDITFKACEFAFKESVMYHHVTLTRSNYSRAKVRYGATERPLLQREQYVEYLFAIYPAMTNENINAKLTVYANTTMRGERIDIYRRRAASTVLTEDQRQVAEDYIKQFESKAVPPMPTLPGTLS
jgi:phage portal protein BeeE